MGTKHVLIILSAESKVCVQLSITMPSELVSIIENLNYIWSVLQKVANSPDTDMSVSG